MAAAGTVAESRARLEATKQSLLAGIEECKERLKNLSTGRKKPAVRWDSSDSETEFLPPRPPCRPARELRAEMKATKICLLATRELRAVTNLQGAARVLPQRPAHVPALPCEDAGGAHPGVWREVTAHCRLESVPFDMNFLEYENSEGALWYRCVSTAPTKPLQASELRRSCVHACRTPSAAFECMSRYSRAYLARRNTLLALADLYDEDALLIHAADDGAYVLSCPTLLMMEWTLVSASSPLLPFRHRILLNVECADEASIAIIQRAHNDLRDPENTIKDRTRLISEIINVCMQAKKGSVSDDDSMDHEQPVLAVRQQRRTTLDHRDDENGVEEDVGRTAKQNMLQKGHRDDKGVKDDVRRAAKRKMMQKDDDENLNKVTQKKKRIEEREENNKTERIKEKDCGDKNEEELRKHHMKKKVEDKKAKNKTENKTQENARGDNIRIEEELRNQQVQKKKVVREREVRQENNKIEKKKQEEVRTDDRNEEELRKQINKKKTTNVEKEVSQDKNRARKNTHEEEMRKQSKTKKVIEDEEFQQNNKKTTTIEKAVSQDNIKVGKNTHEEELRKQQNKKKKAIEEQFKQNNKKMTTIERAVSQDNIKVGKNTHEEELRKQQNKKKKAIEEEFQQNKKKKAIEEEFQQNKKKTTVEEREYPQAKNKIGKNLNEDEVRKQNKKKEGVEVPQEKNKIQKKSQENSHSNDMHSEEISQKQTKSTNKNESEPGKQIKKKNMVEEKRRNEIAKENNSKEKMLQEKNHADINKEELRKKPAKQAVVEKRMEAPQEKMNKEDKNKKEEEKELTAKDSEKNRTTNINKQNGKVVDKTVQNKKQTEKNNEKEEVKKTKANEKPPEVPVKNPEKIHQKEVHLENHKKTTESLINKQKGQLKKKNLVQQVNNKQVKRNNGEAEIRTKTQQNKNKPEVTSLKENVTSEVNTENKQSITAKSNSEMKRKTTNIIQKDKENVNNNAELKIDGKNGAKISNKVQKSQTAIMASRKDEAIKNKNLQNNLPPNPNDISLSPIKKSPPVAGISKSKSKIHANIHNVEPSKMKQMNAKNNTGNCKMNTGKPDFLKSTTEKSNDGKTKSLTSISKLNTEQNKNEQMPNKNENTQNKNGLSSLGKRTISPNKKFQTKIPKMVAGVRSTLSFRGVGVVSPRRSPRAVKNTEGADRMKNYFMNMK